MEKDGIKAWTEDGKVFHIDPAKVVALISERHLRDEDE